VPDRATVPHFLLILTGRGELPFETLHGEPLYLHALRALNQAHPGSGCLVSAPVARAAEVVAEIRAADLDGEVVTAEGWWSRISADGARGLLVHDPLCPLTSPDFLRAVAQGGTRGGSVDDGDSSRIAYRPVTDTVKTVVDGRIVGTIDREGLAAITSPVLIAAAVLERAVVEATLPPLNDLSELVAWLRVRGPVELVRAPSLARRVDDPSAVNLLECVDELSRLTRR
jgi:2-C-methyl-D-erythritol 4-phosphate cytidylyltransferase